MKRHTHTETKKSQEIYEDSLFYPMHYTGDDPDCEKPFIVPIEEWCEIEYIARMSTEELENAICEYDYRKSYAHESQPECVKQAYADYNYGISDATILTWWNDEFMLMTVGIQFRTEDEANKYAQSRNYSRYFDSNNNCFRVPQYLYEQENECEDENVCYGQIIYDGQILYVREN